MTMCFADMHRCQNFQYPMVRDIDWSYFKWNGQKNTDEIVRFEVKSLLKWLVFLKNSASSKFSISIGGIKCAFSV